MAVCALEQLLTSAYSPASRSFNYEEMYEEDEYGKEAFPEARVWKVHNDETQTFDQERVEAWRDALDVLLVFVSGVPRWLEYAEP